MTGATPRAHSAIHTVPYIQSGWPRGRGDRHDRPTAAASALAPRADVDTSLLRVTGVTFVSSRLVHGADHVRRGTDVVTDVVLGFGAAQFVLAGVVLVLVLRRHHLAAGAAVAVAAATTAGVIASHLLPAWSAFNDPFVGAVAPHVNAFSWFSALFEIAPPSLSAWPARGSSARATQ